MRESTRPEKCSLACHEFLTALPICPLSLCVAVAAKMSMESKSDLEALAVKCNPAVGYFEPLGLVDGQF